MKKSILFGLLLSLAFFTHAQDQEKKLDRKERKELRKQENEKREKALRTATSNAIEKKAWVLEADRLMDKRGNIIQVNRTLNFIAIEGEEVFMQIGSNSGYGPNGVGGVTVKGRISGYEVKKNEKRGTYGLQVIVNSSVGAYNISINSNANGQSVSATVQGNTRGMLRYEGKLVPLKMSKVYKGRPSY